MVFRVGKFLSSKQAYSSTLLALVTCTSATLGSIISLDNIYLNWFDNSKIITSSHNVFGLNTINTIQIIQMQASSQQKYNVSLHPHPYAFNDNYCLGQGSFGKVYEGANIQTNKKVAIKELQLSNHLISQKQIYQEIQILNKLEHPNIVKYQAAIKTNQCFYIITEYCNGGDLRNLLGQSDQSEDDNNIEQENTRNDKMEKLINMFFQVCEGFVYLRKKGIIHRDLKPSNILIHNKTYKIADFGVAKTEQLNKSLVYSDIVGVPIYMSPQILSRNYYSYKCDIWSLGVIMFEYYFERMPWKATDINDLFFQIMSNPQPYLQESGQLPHIIRSIFDNTLKYLQKQRMSWQQLLSLNKTRRKIFNLDSSQKPKLEEQSERILSASNICKQIPIHQAQILTHIICQMMSYQSEFITLVGQKCFQAFKSAIQEYSFKGPEYRQLFTDSAFFFLQLAGQNLHMYMMELQELQQSRALLVFLEIVHDLATIDMKKQYNNFQQFKRVMDKTCSKTKIQQFAANVISKINTYKLRQFRQ